MEKVCAVSDVLIDGMKSFHVKDKEILIVNLGGKFYALQGKCSHRGGPLAEGKLENHCVTCPWHKAQFDVTTGKVVKDVGGVMKLFTAGGAKDLQKYKAVVKDGFVFVDL